MAIKNGHGQGQNVFGPFASSYASPKRAPQDLRFKEPVVGHNAGLKMCPTVAILTGGAVFLDSTAFHATAFELHGC